VDCACDAIMFGREPVLEVERAAGTRHCCRCVGRVAVLAAWVFSSIF
jgi:hypothetical protein